MSAGKIWITTLSTPLGPMIAGDYKDRLCLLGFLDSPAPMEELCRLEALLGAGRAEGHGDLHSRAGLELGEYFAGLRKKFTLPLELPGTAFQRAVWNALLAIPWGATMSYRQEAAAMGRPRALRAVASANGRNRVAIVVPCHRVIGADGRLAGYSGGIEKKRALLELEGFRAG